MIIIFLLNQGNNLKTLQMQIYTALYSLVSFYSNKLKIMLNL